MTELDVDGDGRKNSLRLSDRAHSSVITNGSECGGTSMNLRLKILRVLALLLVLPGLGVMLLGVAFGLQGGGWMWLLAAVLIALGGLFISILFRYFRRPSPDASGDIITIVSFVIFGVLSSALRKAAPEAWGLPAWLGIEARNADMVLTLLALLVAWVAHRVLKIFFAGATETVKLAENTL